MTHTEECVTQRKLTCKKGVHTLYIEKEGTHTLLSHVDQARDQYSIVEVRLLAEEKECKEGNHTIFFTTSDTDKAEAITDPKKPRKVKY